MRKKYGVDLAFMLMNSFSTSADTLKVLKAALKTAEVTSK